MRGYALKNGPGMPRVRGILQKRARAAGVWCRHRCHGGGVGGANIARRIGRDAVRRIVVVVGFAMALSLMLRL